MSGLPELAAGAARLLGELALSIQLEGDESFGFEMIAQTVSQLVRNDYVSLAISSGHGSQLVSVGSAPAAIWKPGQPLDLTAEAIGQLALLRKPVYVFEQGHVPGNWDAQFTRSGLTRVALAPLHRDGAFLGIMNVGRQGAETFTPEEVEAIGGVAAIVSNAVGQRRRLDRMKASATRSRIVAELSLRLNDGESVAAMFDRLPGYFAEGAGSDYCALSTRSSVPGQYVVTRSGGGAPHSQMRREETLALTPDHLGGGRATQFEPAAAGLALPELALRGITRVASMALVSGGEVYGRLTVGRHANVPFEAEEMEFIQAIGSVLTQAAASQARTEQVTSEAASQRLVNDLSRLLHAGEPLESVFDSVEALVRQAVNADVVVLLGLHELPGRFRRLGITPGWPELPDGGATFEECGVARLQAYDPPIVQFRPEDLAVEGGRRRLITLGVRRASTALLDNDTEVLGLLTVGRAADEPFSEREMRVIEVVARLLSEAAAGHMRIRRTEQEAEEQRILAVVSGAIATEPDPGELIRLMNRLLPALYPKPTVAFGYDEGDRVSYPMPDGPAMIFPSDAITRQAAKTGQVSARWDDAHAPDGSPFSGRGLQAFAVTACHYGGDVIGYLFCASREDGYVFAERELRVLRSIATRLGPAMANVRAVQRTADERALYDVALRSLSEAVIMLDHEFVARFFNEAARGLVEAGRRFGPSLLEAIPGLPEEARTVLLAAVLKGTPARGITSLEIDRELRWFDFEAIPLKHPVYRMMVVASDVSERVTRERQQERHQEELAAAAESIARERGLYQGILGALHDSVVLLDDDLSVVYANPPGRRIADALGPDGPGLAGLPQLRDAFNEAATTGTPNNGRLKLDVHGETRWFDYDLIPLDQPSPRMLAVGSDVTAEVERATERRLHAEQLDRAARMAALGELISGVAHELNNPLTAILGFAELIAGAAPTELSEDVAIIRKEALRARDVVRDLLFIARPGVTEKASTDLRHVVNHIERLRRPLWMRTGVAVTIDTSGVTGPIWANEHQLTQVLLNLVTNAEHAVETCPNAAIRIAVNASPAGATVTVSDNGVGMDEATRPRIFEPFFTTRQGTGTGLGLPLSFTIVSAHNGHIDVESAPGAGSTFTVVLPASAQPLPEQQSIPARLTERQRVLLIDDDAAVARIAQRLVNNLGHETDRASSVAEAIEMAAASDYDLILCDYRLGTETADRFIDAIALSAPDRLGRIAIVTGATTDERVVSLAEHYDLRLVAKPYTLKDLADLIGSAPRGHLAAEQRV